MKTLWDCGLLSLLLLVVYSLMSVALGGAGEPARGSTHNSKVATNLSEHVFLHETRDESVPLQVAARANVCSGITRGVGVSPHFLWRLTCASVQNMPAQGGMITYTPGCGGGPRPHGWDGSVR